MHSIPLSALVARDYDSNNKTTTKPNQTTIQPDQRFYILIYERRKNISSSYRWVTFSTLWATFSTLWYHKVRRSVLLLFFHQVESFVAQRKRDGPITHRSLDRNQSKLTTFFVPVKITSIRFVIFWFIHSCHLFIFMFIN